MSKILSWLMANGLRLLKGHCPETLPQYDRILETLRNGQTQ